MANVLVEESYLSDIADTIRAKLGVSDTYLPSEMADAIDDIGGGVTPTGTKQITITANGTTTEDVTNYASAEITVNVSGVSWEDIATSAIPSGEVSINGTSIHEYAFANMGYNSWSFVGNNVTSMGINAFRDCKYLTSVRLPALSSYPTTGYAFYGCTSLTLVDYGVMDTVRANTFVNCNALTTIILRRSTAPAALANTTTFNNTPFKSGGSGGTIYIPKVLYDHLGDGTSMDYKALTNWSTVDGYGTITWAKIEGSPYEL